MSIQGQSMLPASCWCDGRVEGSVLITSGTDVNEILCNIQGKILECYLYGGNHYSNMCDQKKYGGDAKKKKAGHLHLTTTDKIDQSFSEDGFEDGFDDWGSVVL
eukprot:13446575-Ditylum_brightwellii.AAC.1